MTAPPLAGIERLGHSLANEAVVPDTVKIVDHAVREHRDRLPNSMRAAERQESAW